MDVRGVRKVHVTYRKENGGQDGAVKQLRRDGDNFLQGKDQLPRRGVHSLEGESGCI